MVGSVLLALVMQVRVMDPVRSAEAAEKLLKARTAAPRQTHQEPSLRSVRFEEKFNALVKAMEAFSRKYNEGNGQVWPQQEASALRKALANLQKLPEIQTNRERAR